MNEWLYICIHYWKQREVNVCACRWKENQPLDRYIILFNERQEFCTLPDWLPARSLADSVCVRHAHERNFVMLCTLISIAKNWVSRKRSMILIRSLSLSVCYTHNMPYICILLHAPLFFFPFFLTTHILSLFFTHSILALLA